MSVKNLKEKVDILNLMERKKYYIKFRTKKMFNIFWNGGNTT